MRNPPAGRTPGRGRRLLAAAGIWGVAVTGLTGFFPAEAPSVASRPPLAGVRVVLDPGHNGRNWAHPEIINRRIYAGNGVYKACNTTGTETAGGYRESAYAFNVARRAAKVLRARGAEVWLTRSDDRGVGPCVPARAALAAKKHADLLLSIHADGNSARHARGFHVIASTKQVGPASATKASDRLARMVRAALRSETPMPIANYVGGGDGLVFRRDLGTLNLSVAPAVLVETGNMRHPKDASLMRKKRFRQAEARAFADAVGRFLHR